MKRDANWLQFLPEHEPWQSIIGHDSNRKCGEP